MTLADLGRYKLMLVPGLFATKLEEQATHQAIWDGSPLSKAAAVTRNRSRLTYKPDDCSVVPTDLIGYEDLLSRLQGAPANRQMDRDLFVYPYDWRADLEDTARQLAAVMLEQDDSSGDDRKWVLIGHSMGGLVARICVSQCFSSDDRVACLLELGVPKLGSIKAFLALTNLRDAYPWFDSWLLEAASKGLLSVSLRRFQNEVVASYPSIYQVLPSENALVLIENPSGTLRNVYDFPAWHDEQLTLLDRAKVVQRMLSEPTGVAIKHTIFSRRFKTDHLAAYNVRGDGARVNVIPAEADGDKVVTMESATVDCDRSLESQGDHGGLINADEVMGCLRMLFPE